MELRKSRRKWPFVAALVFAGTGLLFLRSEEDQQTTGSSEEEPSVASSKPNFGSTAERAVPPSPSATPETLHPDPKPVDVGTLIGDVSLESTTACLGEDLKITMKPVPEAPNTVFNVEGAFGNELILRPRMPFHEDFWVVAAHENLRDFRKVSVEVLPPEHPQCRDKPTLGIVAQRVPGTTDTFTFEAVPVRGLGPVGRVEWSFGDGSSQQAGAKAQHDYMARAQHAEASSFIVSAEVTDALGRRVRGRTGISLQNLHYQARASAGNRPLPVKHDTFASNEQRTDFQAEVVNTEEDDVVLDEARVRLRPCKGGETKEHVVPAAQILSQTALASGKKTKTQVKLDRAWTTKGVCQVDLQLVGDTNPPSVGMPLPNGVPLQEVTVELSLHLGMPARAEDGGDPDLAVQRIEDPQLVARMVAIMKANGTNHMTSEDLEAALVAQP